MPKQVIDGQTVPIKIWTDQIESEALNQLYRLSSLPFIHNHIAVMPDVHAGIGSTIGTVIATKGAIIPSAVGVDIGCGMCALQLPFKIDVISDKFKQIRGAIERTIPLGTDVNKSLNSTTRNYFDRLGELKCFDQASKEFKRALLALGSLGGGNHFIEICYDEQENAWLMLHSGSRNIGKTVADFHINKAKGYIKNYFINLPDPNLAYLVQGTMEFNDYVHDMHWCQLYAKFNRQEMLNRILREIAYIVYKDFDVSRFNGLRVDCHHNYSQMEEHYGAKVFVTRKGAVSAQNGEFGIIPGSMGAKSFIVKGKGNIESFCSCSHGAGRVMSRTQARKTFVKEDLISQTRGVECRKDISLIDEIPSAYKSIEEVMDNQTDLVDIVYALKQVVCIKG